METKEAADSATSKKQRPDSSASDHDQLHTEQPSGVVRPPGSGTLSPVSTVASSRDSATEGLPRPPGRKLPTPNPTSLRPGGNKEAAVRLHLEKCLRRIERRGTLSRTRMMSVGDAMFVEAEEHGPDIGAGIGDTYGAAGYTSYSELARALSKLIDVLWMLNTPSLQAQYFLNLALHAVNYIPSYPAAPKAMFRLLDKLDLVFASLIRGVDLETGSPLARNASGLPVFSLTDKVRLRGLVERTRVAVAKIMDTSSQVGDSNEDDEIEYGDDGEPMEDIKQTSILEVAGKDKGETLGEDFDREGEFDMRTGQVYERTLSLLGDTIDGTLRDEKEDGPT